MSRPDKTNSEPSVDEQVAKIFAWRRGFNTIFLIDIGVDLGLFKALAEEPDRTAADISEKLKLHAHYVDVWCLTAFGLGLLDADEKRRFRLAPHMDKILASPGHPRDLTGYVRLGTAFKITGDLVAVLPGTDDGNLYFWEHTSPFSYYESLLVKS